MGGINIQTVKIQSINNTTFSRVFLGDKKLEGVKEIAFNQSAGIAPCFTFETRGFPDIEISNADVQFCFTPKTIDDAMKVIYHSFSTDETLYGAFTASIASALKEIPAGTGLYDVAKAVADRVIGRE